MKKITLIIGIAVIAMSLTFLSSCKKEEITSKKTVSQSGNPNPAKHEYKFSSVAKIPGETPENGFLSVKVSSNDEDYLEQYISKLEKSKVTFVESDPSKPEEATPLSDDETGSVKLHFDWSHFNKNLEKGKLYALYMKNTNEKSLIHFYTFSNISSFTTTSGYACVNILNTTPWTTDCFCNPTVDWRFYNAANSKFCNQVMSSGSNFEIRTFSGYSSSTWNFSIGGTTVYYQPRYNYSGTLITGTLSDYNAIRKGDNYLVPSPHLEGKATATFYIAG